LRIDFGRGLLIPK